MLERSRGHARRTRNETSVPTSLTVIGSRSRPVRKAPGGSWGHHALGLEGLLSRRGRVPHPCNLVVLALQSVPAS